MVIKILGSSTSFSGIEYNEKKVDSGKAHLMGTNNIPISTDNPNNIVKYLDKVSSLNPGVINVQFHASISTKEREHSFEQLEKVAKKYLKEMGYENSPYLIYAHSDSPNNHVHIVATRVDNTGKKVADSLEKHRTQKFIKNKLHINFSKDVKSIINQALNYNFKDTKSLQALLKKQGYKSRLDKSGNLEVIKSGEIQSTISKKVIHKKKHFSKIDFDKKKILLAHLHKYAKGSNFDSLQKDMHKKFGLEIIYNYTTNQDNQNHERGSSVVSDYNLIDHKNNVAYNSSDLISIEKLQSHFDILITENNVLSTKDLADVIYSIKKEPDTYFSVKNYFKENDLLLDKDGQIKSSSGEVVGSFDKSTMESLMYNQRYEDSKKAIYTSSLDESTLARVYRINPSDVVLTPQSLKAKEIERYSSIVNSFLNRNKNEPQNIDNIKIYNNGKGGLLIDKKNAIVIDIKKDLDINIPENKKENIPYMNNQSSSYPTKKGVIADTLLSLLDDGGDGEGDAKKKRKRKQQSQQNIN